MADSQVGKNQKVTLGANKVLGIGNWSMAGQTIQMLDDTEYGDDYTSYCPNVIDGGTITFGGNAKLGDTTGQDALDDAFDGKVNLTSMRFYVNKTSYYEACQTTSYLRPNNTSAGNTVLSHANITAKPITSDKGALLAISFTLHISGQFVLV